MLKIEEAKEIIKRFGIDDSISSVICIQESISDYRYRGVFRLITEKNVLICRISNEENYPSALVEKQSQFAMLLYQSGINTAKKLTCQGMYCIEHYVSGSYMCVTLEEDIGHDVSEITVDSFFVFGELLGKMHTVSQNSGVTIGKSFIFDAIHSSKACFSRILEKANPPLPEAIYISESEQRHDQLVAELSEIWSSLPSGAVHGDLGLYNNLMETKDGWGIIDFNLAGDEVYLGDALSSYYASIHKYSWQRKYDGMDMNLAFQLYWNGYAKYHTITRLEQNYFSRVAALFDGLFYCKCAIEIWNAGKHEEALIKLQNAREHFDTINHFIPE